MELYSVHVWRWLAWAALCVRRCVLHRGVKKIVFIFPPGHGAGKRINISVKKTFVSIHKTHKHQLLFPLQTHQRIPRVRRRTLPAPPPCTRNEGHRGISSLFLRRFILSSRRRRQAASAEGGVVLYFFVHTSSSLKSLKRGKVKGWWWRGFLMSR